MHSSFSGDSDTPMEQMIQAGIQNGLAGICFTEHLDLDFPDTPDHFDFTIDFPTYHALFLELKEKYRNQISLHYGMELGLQPHLADTFDQILHDHSFDFVIGSVHLLNGCDPYYPETFAGKDESECYRRYFESILMNLQVFSGFDSLGHLDYIVRYGPNRNKDYSYSEYRDIIDAILEQLIRRDIALELNTAGYHAGLGSPNPCMEVLRRYKELGGKMITIGSDAHIPERVASHFEDASELLKSLGFTAYTVFHNHIPEFHRIK